MSLVVTFKSPFHLLRPHTVRFPSYNHNEIRGSCYLFIKKYSLASYYAPFKKEEGMLNFALKYRHKLLSLTKRASTGDFSSVVDVKKPQRSYSSSTVDELRLLCSLKEQGLLWEYNLLLNYFNSRMIGSNFPTCSLKLFKTSGLPKGNS